MGCSCIGQLSNLYHRCVEELLSRGCMKNKTDRDGILSFSSAVDITLEEDSHRPLSPLISVDFFEMNRSGSADAGWSCVAAWRAADFSCPRTACADGLVAGNTALMLASQEGHAESVRHLLRMRCSNIARKF